MLISRDVCLRKTQNILSHRGIDSVTSADPQMQRDFALEVLQTLRRHGYTAYWAGGCVRDMLLDRVPKDYDVATDATPQLVREVFGRRRTIFTGAVFGVVNVLGPHHTANVEVATFRSDAAYSDGRHPDSVTFTTPEVDAQRRDFTINGLFYDPIDEQVIDFVDGQQDLRQKLVRAIGDPVARFTEDKLRMLRAVRFTATFDFHLDEETATAIGRMAQEVRVVSVERIAQELRRMLTGPRPKLSVQLLHGTGLLKAVLPEAASMADADASLRSETTDAVSPWSRTLALLNAMSHVEFRLAAAALLHAVGQPPEHECNRMVREEVARRSAELVNHICRALKLSTREREDIAWLVANQHALRAARSLRWSQLQPLVVDPRFESLVVLERIAARSENRSEAEADYCQAVLARPRDAIDPPSLLCGGDLIRHGVKRGRVFATLLDAIRDAQLDGEVASREEALELVDRLIAEHSGDPGKGGDSEDGSSV